VYINVINVELVGIKITITKMIFQIQLGIHVLALGVEVEQ
jgi:hypothetical protein